MARIRTIKPEYWTSDQVADCSPIARLLFVGLWNFCDDAGRHPAKARRVKMEVFPGDAFSAEEVQAWIDELIEADLLIPYEVDGKHYWQVTGWHHQKIDKPNIKHPAPPEIRQPVADQSTTSSRTVADQSTTSSRPVDDSSPPEGKGRDIEGKEPPLTPPSQGGRKASSRGQRLPDDWTLPDTWAAEAKRICRDMGADIAVSYEAERFRDYWLGVGGSKGCKRDWLATWRNWIRLACERQPTRGKAKPDPMRGAI